MSLLSIETNEATPRKISVLAGVIRRVGNSWIFLNDAGHASIGFTPTITEPSTNSIQINFDKTYSKVLTCIVTPDDTYAQRGIVFGASCGLNKAIIYHSKAGVPTLNSELNITGSNVWIYIMMYD